jgi:outer membrane immunogenic protein
MRKLFLASVTAMVTFVGGAATAADLPAKAPAAVAPRPACAQFGGFYAGVNGGWANLRTTWVDRDAWVDNFGTDWALGSVNNDKGGGTAGGQIGYNWQLTPCTVFGVELDANWTGISDTRGYTPVDIGGTGTALTLEDRMRWFGTARARGGVVVDNVLIYLTGGFAYANIKHTWTITDPSASPTVESFSSSAGRWGGVVGFGSEWAFNRNWSLKSEVLYILFQDKHTTVFSPNGPCNCRFDLQDSMWVSRIGVNYRW